jgi:general secretion pathway protein L
MAIDEHQRMEFQRNIGNAVFGFFHWWKNGLMTCIPQWLQSRFISAQTRLVLTLTDATAEVERISFEGEVLERFALSEPMELNLLKRADDSDALSIEVVVPSEWVLHKSISLPSAALKNLHQVLIYELDRLTPFTPEDVYFDYILGANSNKEAHLDVRIALIQRHLIDKWIDGLLRENIRPVLIASEGIWEGLNFVKSITRLAALQKNSRNYLRVGLLACATILFAAVLITPLWQKRAATLIINNHVEQARREAETVLALKSKIEEVESSLNFVLDQRNNKTPVIQVLDIVTRLLPDDTWTQQLELKRDVIELRGESRQATQLIKLLEDSPYFTDAAFRSPVVQARDKERYHVAARLMVSGTN